MNEDTAGLIAQARAWPSNMGEGWLFNALADALEAAQATIAEAKSAWFGPCQFDLTIDGPKVTNALARADTSALRAHDEALIRQHTQTILDATREATVQEIADAEVRGYQRKVDERITSALAASIEQTQQRAAR